VPEERSELVPSREPAFGGLALDVVRRPERLLRPDHELTDLVGEPAEPEQRAEDRPALGILAVEELPHPQELLRRRQHRRRRGVPEPLEPLADHVEREAVDRHDGQVRQCDREAFEQQAPGLVPRAPRTHDERHAFWDRRPLDEPREPFAQHRRLAGARSARDEHRAVGVVEDRTLPRVRGRRVRRGPSARCYRRARTRPGTAAINPPCAAAPVDSRSR
jgi:hypothetical protein